MKKKKTIIAFFLILVIIINFIKITKVFASSEPVSIESIDVSEKSEDAIVNSIDYGKTSINTDVTFYNLGDYITYKVVIKNNDEKDYKISIQEKYGENNHITYQCIYSSGEFRAKDTKELLVKAMYTKGITDINDRIQKEDAELIITLEDIEGNEKEEIIPINNKTTSNSPTTGDSIGLYVVTEILALFALLMVLRKKQPRSSTRAKHVKGKRFFSIVIAGLIIVPTMTKAFSQVTVINISTSMNLQDNLIVTYDVNGEVEQEIVKYNSELSNLSDVSIPGYTFKGWYTKQDGGEKVDNSYVVKEDITLYAQFDIIEYQIEYDLGDGTAENPETYTVEDEITLNNPEKQGYTFSGWTGSNGTSLQTAVTISKGSTGNKKYKANYSPKDDTTYTVRHLTMDLDGVNYTEKLVEELHGATDSTVKPEVKDYEGFTVPEEQELKIKADGTSSVTYKYTRKKFEFGFNNNEYVDTTKTTEPGTYFYGKDIKATAKDKTGYHFVKWSNGKITKEIEFELIENTIIEPEYEANQYVIVFNSNGGSGEMSNQTLTYDQSANLNENTFSKQGYNFVGWNTKADGSGESYTDKKSVKNLTDQEEVIILYAQYVPKTDTPYTVVHELMNVTGNGYTVKETDHLTGTTDTTIKPNLHEYYGFDAPNKEDLTITADGNASLTYKYNRKKFRLTINNSEYVETSTPSGDYYYETEIKLKAKDIENAIFKKWSNGETSKEITFKLEEDITIEPIYKANQYVVTYDANGGVFDSGDTTNLVTYNSSNQVKSGRYKVPSNGTLLGFGGWYTTEDCIEGSEFDVSIYEEGEDITVYAKWQNLRAKFNARSMYRNTHDGMALNENGESKRIKFITKAIKQSDSIPSWAEGKNWGNNLGKSDTYQYLYGNMGESGDSIYKVPILFWFDKTDYTIYWYSEDNYPVVECTDQYGKTMMCSDYSEITDISGMKNWDVSNLETLEDVFKNCIKLTDLSPIQNWNTKNVTNMKNAFYGMTSLTDASPINGWDVSSVTDFTDMFRNTTAKPTYFTKNGGTVSITWTGAGNGTPQVP